MQLRYLTLLTFLTLTAYADNGTLVRAGTFDTAVGSPKPGPAMPGQSFAFDVQVDPSEVLNFTSMYGISNDWFFSSDSFIALYDKYNKILPDGDKTAAVGVFDAGTEVDENQADAPSTGPNQPYPNYGLADPVPYVRSLSNFANFKANKFITLTTSSLGDNKFRIQIEVLAASPTPLSPGVFWVSKSAPAPQGGFRVFTLNEAAPANGLEHQAEDGNPSALYEYLQGSLASGLK